MVPRNVLSTAVLLFASSAHGFHQANLRFQDSRWTAYEHGFVLRAGLGESGGAAFYCESSRTDEGHGAQYRVTLNQPKARPFMVSAWSRSEDVSGTGDGDYSLYLDLAYMDCDHLWGSIAPFDGGTHGWQQRHVRVFPSKPVREVYVFLLLRKHTGKAWFSDVAFADLGGKGSFDFQALSAPVVKGSGWFVRDVAADSPIVPASQVHGLRIQITHDMADGNTHSRLTVVSTEQRARALTLYYCEHVDARAGRWWNTIRDAKAMGDTECAAVTRVSTGANGLSSLYPFAAVTTAHLGWMLAVPPSMGPRIVRLFYNPASKLLCAAFDVALTPMNHLRPISASAEVISSTVDPTWGFRDAARRYYLAYPDAFRNRMPKQGIWIPFTSPAAVPHAEDFGIAVHEGDDSVASDAKLGILSFRYTEPMTWWMNMDPAIPRTYSAAIDVLNKNLHGSDAEAKRRAEAVRSSGTYGRDGRYNLSFENEPWANGALWVLNPNPAMPRASRATQADVDFDTWEAAKRYGNTRLSGEYLDSLEAHSDLVDYRKESLAASSLPPSFDEETKAPVIPQAYSTWEMTKFMSNWLHARGRLLMANTTPVDYFGYMPWLDCAGIEVNWLDGGTWTPDSDDTFCYRRTLSYQKPYMLLQNTDFSKFGPEQVALYFQKCLFYGVYPSFFSANAATHVYWENPALYERDRAQFKRFIPLIRMISEAGWEPVTYSRTSDLAVFIERYGQHIWTVFNNATASKSFVVAFDRAPQAQSAEDLRTGKRFNIKGRSLACSLAPGDCMVLRL